MAFKFTNDIIMIMVVEHFKLQQLFFDSLNDLIDGNTCSNLANFH